ncbi:MAG TPA: 2-hydroxychromene-2-carboxylate isomerase [Sphingomonadales bacterium]|nr:2-hydroxychromene-2-carboxylate isomerase [Sphingomonadales bacterium]
MSELHFWYEFSSPTSYLAAMRLDELAKAKGVATVWQPFMWGGLVRMQNPSPPPPEVAQVRADYMWRDAERQAKRYGLPFKKPTKFPRPAGLAAQVAQLGISERWGKVFSRKVLAANFVEDLDIQEPKVIGSVLARMDLNPESVMKRALTEDIKAALKRETERAYEKGYFGVPTFVVGDEMFWGEDRLEQALETAARA